MLSALLQNISGMGEFRWTLALWLAGISMVMKVIVPVFFKRIKSHFILKKSQQVTQDESQIPLSVNYHFTRKCNYECKFCFHQAKTSYHLPIEEAKKGIKMLVDAGMKKINFSGKIVLQLFQS
jgi:hypothetical protein